MTKALYMEDSYLKEFEATVDEVRGESVILDQSAFYPGGGGVPNDTGKITVGNRELVVPEVTRKGADVLHRVHGELPRPGTKVLGTIDWDRRYAHMRYHTAIHVLCGVVYNLFKSQVTGGQIRADKARIDFDLEELSPEVVHRIENEANQIVREGRPVMIKSLRREDALRIPGLVRTKTGRKLVERLPEIRVVEIRDLDIQADGGPHIASTGEVGPIKIVDALSKGRHNKRLVITLE